MIKRMSIALTGLAVLMFMAACGNGDPTPIPTTVPTATNVPDPAQAALLQSQERWEQSGITDYVYSGAWTCFCPEEYLAETRVSVSGGEVTEVRSAAQNSGTVPAPERFVPIEGLFALIQNAIAQDAAEIEVSYDETYGYPSRLFIDYDDRMADEEESFAISSFSPA